jgi:hypothetical protein
MSGARKKSKDHGANDGHCHPGLRRDAVDRERLDQKVGNRDHSPEQKILISYFLMTPSHSGFKQEWRLVHRRSCR